MSRGMRGKKKEEMLGDFVAKCYEVVMMEKYLKHGLEYLKYGVGIDLLENI